MHISSRPAPWWQHAVCYQIYVRSFADSDGDGVGDMAGIAQRLPYLADLGVDALPVVEEPHVVVGRHLGADGRKSFTASTLYDSDGRVVGAARHTWIQVDPAAFN